ncbi:hypothetical protein GOODEAATRI_017924 [Goodea atripinnis]|uniref:Carrier domain-containing protein n=1 Tax=Goodea atripinnis TaxID=208336 RepID=A0ABV0NBG7_9TELE
MTMAARTLQELVSTAASLHADRAAVLYDSGPGGTEASGSLLYSEVAQLSDGLAAVLLKNCCPSSGVIGLYCSDDLLVPVWILGYVWTRFSSTMPVFQNLSHPATLSVRILQSSAAYVPLDPEAPGLLSARIMRQCGLKYCAVRRDLVQEALVNHVSVEVCVELPQFRLTLMRIEPHPVAKDETQTAQRAGGCDPCPRTVLLKDSGCPDLAYVLHTSGTTGPPKTVRVPHMCIVPNILHLRSLFQMSTEDVVFLASPLTFDPSVVDIFLALSSGALLLILPAVIKKMPSRLAQLLFKGHRTTVLQVTPTLLMRFGHHILKRDVLSSGSSLRVLALGGEACPSPAQLSGWKHEDNKTCIYNIYGITEVSCWASCYRIPEPLLQSSDLVCLLDGEDTVVPGTMRATGDWVNIRDAQLYYLGRRDRMIKRNGKRVNLDSLQQVEACAVGLYEGFRLLAFVVPSTSEVHHHQGEPDDADRALQRLILKKLSLLVSSHCIPDTLVLVPAVSLTPHDASIDERSNFLFSGGDSLKALRLCEDILAAVGVSSPQLLEVILDRTFSDVLHHVTQILSERDGSSSSTEKRAANLPLNWSSDTGRCVDASPVILVQDAANGTSRTTVFIGSHSHRIQALDLLSGNLLWERVVGDRIEASATVSHCGSLVVVGSYDGCVYFLCTKSGETRWMYKTEDAVKSSPAVDPLTGLVVVGSHDGHVYALDPQLRQCVWKRHCGGGAVFSSPHLQPSHRRLYAASLGGRLLCVNLDSGDVLWSYCRDKPFFSSPTCFCGHIVIGSVDGNICCLSDAGELLWQFLTEAPVFSSPSFVPGQQTLLCGSHDGRLYCLNSADGSLIWSFQTSSKVYSTPCVFEGSAVGSRGVLVGLASTDGTVWILGAQDGHVLASHALPGELFSSPVVWEQSLVIGCRNDYVYCLNLTVNVEKS